MQAQAQMLVGRTSEVEVLDRLLDGVCAGAPRVVAVTGEPGIGKTSLLLHLARRAEEQDCVVLDGRAAEFERDLPFGLVIDALDAHLQTLDARAFDRLAADELGELSAVFPSLRAVGAAAGRPATVTERFRAHHAVRELIERLAVPRPLVVVLDDLQWSDGASLELVAHLLRRPPEAAVLLALAYRTGRAAPVLAGAVEAAALAGDVELLVLGPLASADAERLTGLEDATAQADLYRASGGNPFYLLQLARARRRGDGRTAPDGTGDIPGPVRTAIAAELTDLAPDVRAFAQAVAVAGDPFDLDLGVAAAAVDEPAALAAVDELVARDLLRPSDTPRRFQFRHPLVRGAVYASCPAGTRLAAHERSAAALAAGGAEAGVRAHHVEQSARRGDLVAVAVLREAAEAAARRAPSSAARWLQAALRLLPPSAPAGERAGLLTELAGAQTATGQLREAHAALVEALELMTAGGGPPPVSLVSACAGVEQLLGRPDAARERLRAAIAALPAPRSRDGAALTLDLAVDAFYRADYAEMLALSGQACATARAAGDEALTAAAAAIAAFAGASTGAIEEAQGFRREAAALVDAMPDARLIERLDATGWLSGAELYLDRYGEGTVHAERGLALARATSQDGVLPMLIQALANHQILTGRLDEAAELLDGAAEAARLANSPVGLAWCLLNRAYTALCGGDLPVATDAGEDAVALTSELVGTAVAAWAAVVTAAVRVEAGRPEAALQLLLDGAGGPGLDLIPGAWRAVWLDVLTRAYLAAGRSAEARTAAGRADAWAERFGLPLARAAADRALAAVALADGDPAAAARLALAGAECADGIGALLDAAHARLLAGRALREAGDRDAAVSELQRAADVFEACGALRHRDKAERELRAAGQAVHRRTRPGRADESGLAALTGRELEIARLVVDRRRNAEIAAELFLSIKTVEAHMRNIFRKLGVDSRVEVARALERAQG